MSLSQKRKILILTEGGERIGFGHLTRCISLYGAFCEEGLLTKIIANKDKSSETLLKGKDYQLFNWNAEEDKLFVLIKDVDIVIIDSYLARKPLYDKISKIVDGRLVMIDDYNRLKYPKGIVVNPSIYGDRIKYPRGSGITYLTGKDFVILRREFCSVQKKIINKEIKDVLITFGGRDYGDLIYRIISHLRDEFNFIFNFIDIKKNIVDSGKMRDLMLKSDICFSGSGQTLHELAICGTPVIGICFADNQLLNLREWSKKGFLEFAGWYNDKNLFKKTKALIYKMDYIKRVKMSRSGRKLVDGQGAKRLVGEILKMSGYKNN